MTSHVALLVAITSIKNYHLFLYGLAKYKFSKEISQTVRWKYFFTMNKQPQQYTPSDLVFISEKYVIENLEQCITISYKSIINNKNPNHEFAVSDVPECVPHCMISMTANRKLKEVEDYVYFGVESVEYNSVTGSSAVKMQITVLYSSQATRFQKYLGTSDSNIKLGNMNRSIIDIVANDIKSVSAQIPLKHAGSFASSDKPSNIGAFESMEILVDADVKTGSCSKENEKKSNQPNYIELDDHDDENDGPDFKDEDELDDKLISRMRNSKHKHLNSRLQGQNYYLNQRTSDLEREKSNLQSLIEAGQRELKNRRNEVTNYSNQLTVAQNQLRRMEKNNT
ncbi:hypothetical protein C2G38_2138137 [Gigaspora rosea]|uniref:Uncharacterized protein n=1 Tax=Gigaspora rosea TaxID=44941 RepID=A0A397W3D2_9GLOM|nr:hypothetical protein C2G38_2138137 [Gigaspora rosea]